MLRVLQGEGRQWLILKNVGVTPENAEGIFERTLVIDFRENEYLVYGLCGRPVQVRKNLSRRESGAGDVPIESGHAGVYLDTRMDLLHGHKRATLNGVADALPLVLEAVPIGVRKRLPATLLARGCGGVV